MPATPASNEISIQPNNGSSIIPVNNATSNTNIPTIKRDSSQQQLQQLQQYSQQQNQTVTNQTQQYAKAQLICRPNSHPFPVRVIFNHRT